MNKEKIILVLILIAGFFIRYGVVQSAGEMFDEIAVVRNGEIYLGAIKNLDFSDDIWGIGYEHPPVAKYIFGSGAKIQRHIPLIHNIFDSGFRFDKGYFLARFFSILMGLLCVYLVYVVGKKWFSSNVGLLASAFLAFSPHFISHNAIAGLETPQALFSILLVYFYIEGLLDKKGINNRKLLLSFGMFGLLFMTKFSGAFYLFFYLSTLIYLNFKKKVKFDMKLIKIHLLGVLLFGIMVYALWPWLWANPLKLLESFGYFANSHSGEYFMGSLGQPQWYYYFLYLFATTPPVLLFFGLFAFIRVIDFRNKSLYLPIIFFWFISPFVISFLGLKQDGIRYVFSYIPALCIASSYGLNLLINEFKSKLLSAVLITVTISTVFWSLYKFYPYYLDYYNIIFGGTKRVYDNKTFDHAWWGEGIRESVEYVNENYSDISVMTFFRPAHTSPLFKDGIIFVNTFDYSNSPDLLLISEGKDLTYEEISYFDNYSKIKSIDVNETPLVLIYMRNDSSAKKMLE